MNKVLGIIKYLGYHKYDTREDFDKKFPTHYTCRLTSEPSEFPVYVQNNGLIGEFGDIHISYKLKYLYNSDIKNMANL